MADEERKVAENADVAKKKVKRFAYQDVEATVAQIKKLTKAGCDIIRCAVPTMEAAKALAKIKEQIEIPIVAGRR